MTVGVYGFVAALVKLDDAGYYLLERPGAGARAAGRALLVAAPALMKFLSVAGTVAMFMVGGGIVAHGMPPLAHLAHGAAHLGHGVPLLGPVLYVLAPLVFDVLAGIATGALTLIAVGAARRLLDALRG